MSKPVVITVVAVVVAALIGSLALHFYRRSLLSEAERLLNQGRYEQVINHLQSRVSGSSGSEEERVALATAQYRLRQYDPALQTLEPLLQYGNLEPRAVAIAGWIALEKNTPIQAKERFDQLASLGQEAEAEAGLAGVSLIRSEGFKKSELNQAEDHLMKATTLGVTAAEAHLVQAELRLLQHQLKAALEATQKAVEAAPYWAEPHVVQGRVYLLTDQSTQARKAFEKALELGAPQEETQFYLARAVYTEHNLSEALDLYQKLIDLKGEYARAALDDTARIYLTTGEVDRAVGILRSVWEMKRNPQTGFLIYEILARQEKWTEAEKMLNQVLADYPFVMEAQMEQAHRQFLLGDLTQTYNSYQAVLDDDADNWLAYYNLGCLVMRRGDFQQAPDYFHSSTERAESYLPAHINYVLSLLAVERGEEALPILQELHEAYPGDARVAQARALERFSAGYSEVALQLLREAESSPANRAAGALIQGEIGLRLFQFRPALDHFEAALAAAANSPRARLGAAHSRIRLGDALHAEPLYNSLLERGNALPPAVLVEARNGKAQVQLQQGQEIEAVAAWREMQRDSGLGRQLALVNSALTHPEQPSPEDIDQLSKMTLETAAIPEVFYNLALLRENSGQSEEAGESYTALIERYPNYVPGLFNCAEWNRSRKRLEEAINYYERARKAAPQRTDILNNEAAAVLSLQDYDRADDLLQQAAALDAGEPMLHYNRALVALYKGDPGEVRNRLRTIPAKPASDAQMIEGLLQASEGDWAAAGETFGRIGQQAVDDPYVFLNRGIALAKSGQFDAAESAVQDALALDSGLADSQRVMGLLYCQMGLYTQAEGYLETALQLDPQQEDLNAILNQIRGWTPE